METVAVLSAPIPSCLSSRRRLGCITHNMNMNVATSGARHPNQTSLQSHAGKAYGLRKSWMHTCSCSTVRSAAGTYTLTGQHEGTSPPPCPPSQLMSKSQHACHVSSSSKAWDRLCWDGLHRLQHLWHWAVRVGASALILLLATSAGPLTAHARARDTMVHHSQATATATPWASQPAAAAPTASYSSSTTAAAGSCSSPASMSYTLLDRDTLPPPPTASAWWQGAQGGPLLAPGDEVHLRALRAQDRSGVAASTSASASSSHAAVARQAAHHSSSSSSSSTGTSHHSLQQHQHSMAGPGQFSNGSSNSSSSSAESSSSSARLRSPLQQTPNSSSQSSRETASEMWSQHRSASNSTAATATRPQPVARLADAEGGSSIFPADMAGAATAVPIDNADLSPAELDAVQLFERCSQSVVNISHMRAMQSFHSLDICKLPLGQGSGFIWDNRGHVVSSYRLVKGAGEVKVTLADLSTHTAKVVGLDPLKDLAVLKLSMPKSKVKQLQPVALGSSTGLRVGQTVYAIGNPFGLDHTFSKGVVSGLGREVSVGILAVKNVIQTDAAINAGNSGGVLLDSKGRVVGVNTAAMEGGRGGCTAGLGFATPIDTVRGLVDQILLHGRVVRPSLGITLAPPQVLQRMGVPGVLVLEVPPGSPAQAAGLRPSHRDIFGDLILGDIITAIDGRPIATYHDLHTALDERKPGERVKVEVVRDSKATSLTLTLGERALGLVEE